MENVQMRLKTSYRSSHLTQFSQSQFKTQHVGKHYIPYPLRHACTTLLGRTGDLKFYDQFPRLGLVWKFNPYQMLSSRVLRTFQRFA